MSKTVVDVIWAAVGPLLPRGSEGRPLGCHRPRVCDRLCLRGIIIRLVTGCSWESVECLLDGEVSDTTLRSRRDEWAAAGANRNDIMLFEPTIAEIERRGLHHDIDTVHLDRGYIGARVDRAARKAGVTDIVRPHKRKPSSGPAEPAPAPLGLRWTVERTNSWLSNYGQLRRNTDRKPEHRLAQFALAITLIITIKLIDHRDRWQPHLPPIR
ncbi:transposase [Candidatus Poriferisodalis sp.]|uniref:transposase n=1 Tax=Candidatus Poriferisodalis sp. TaxID=3101277 RepID=UPI003B014873